MAMTTFSNEIMAFSVVCSNDEYWIDDNAAAPVLLVDQAAEAITEALHHVRSGTVLDSRDLAAAGVALGDLLGGLGQLTGLLRASTDKYTGTAPLELRRLRDWLETMRTTTLHAQQAAQGVQLASTAISSVENLD